MMQGFPRRKKGSVLGGGEKKAAASSSSLRPPQFLSPLNLHTDTLLLETQVHTQMQKSHVSVVWCVVCLFMYHVFEGDGGWEDVGRKDVRGYGSVALLSVSVCDEERRVRQKIGSKPRRGGLVCACALTHA